LFFARDELQRVAVGAAQQNINQAVIRNLKILLPPLNLVQEFNETIEPLYRKKVENIREIRVLTDLRDALLPKLMSGDLRIKAN
jgi:type I restriction enzyme S subunit